MSNNRPKGVTDDEIVEVIKRFIDKYKWSPSVREIASELGLTSSGSMQERLVSLKNKGRIIYIGVRQIRVM